MRSVLFAVLCSMLGGTVDSKDAECKARRASQLENVLTVSLVAPGKPTCEGGPIELVGALENIGDRELLLADPGRCRTCLFFQVENSDGRKVNPVWPEGRMPLIHESKPKMILLRPGTRAEFRRDIAVQAGAATRYQLAAGKYRMAVVFLNPGGFRTPTGTRAVSGVVESRPLEVIVGGCSAAR